MKISKFILAMVFMVISINSNIFASTAEIKIQGETGYKAIRLTPEIYSGSNQNLSDILIKDSKGDNIPYFINSTTENEYNIEEQIPMELINSYTKEDNFYFDYKIFIKEDDAKNKDTIATNILFYSNNKNFAKVVDVYGSYDNINWEFVQNDKLYNVDNNKKLNINLFKPQKYTYYRFKIANNLEEISFYNVNLVYQVKTQEASYFIENINAKFTVEEKDKKTFIEIQGVKNLRLHGIDIIPSSTTNPFKRTATTQEGIRKILYYRISGPKPGMDVGTVMRTDTLIPSRGDIPDDNIYTVIINNNDDKPIEISGVTVYYYADDIIFKGKIDEKYTLDFGNVSRDTPPIYDIKSFKNEIMKNPMERVAIGEVTHEKVEIKVEKDYKNIFNIVVVIIALILGALIIFKLKNEK